MTAFDAYDTAALWFFGAILVSLIAGLAISALIRWVDTPTNRYVERDWHTERKCRMTRRGFKTRAGIR